MEQRLTDLSIATATSKESDRVGAAVAAEEHALQIAALKQECSSAMFLAEASLLELRRQLEGAETERDAAVSLQMALRQRSQQLEDDLAMQQVCVAVRRGSFYLITSVSQRVSVLFLCLVASVWLLLQSELEDMREITIAQATADVLSQATIRASLSEQVTYLHPKYDTPSQPVLTHCE